MLRANPDYAIKTAIELAKINLEGKANFVNAETVTAFIGKVYAFLAQEDLPTDCKDE